MSRARIVLPFDLRLIDNRACTCAGWRVQVARRDKGAAHVEVTTLRGSVFAECDTLAEAYDCALTMAARFGQPRAVA